MTTQSQREKFKKYQIVRTIKNKNHNFIILPLGLSRPGLGKTIHKCSCLCPFTEYIDDFILVPTEELHPELDFAGLFGQTVADLVEGVYTLIIPKQD